MGGGTGRVGLLGNSGKDMAWKVEKQAVVDELMREVMSLWQTDEIRRSKPTPLDGR